MKITLTRTGGFAGITLKKTIDTASLPPHEKEKIEGFFAKVPKEPKETEVTTNQPSTSLRQKRSTLSKQSASKGLPDRFTYKISIEDGERNQEITVPEEDMSEEMKKLIENLKNS